MTVIAAIREKGVTWIGSDTQATNSGTTLRAVSKWHIAKPWAIGSAGNLRTNTLISAHLNDLFDGLAGAFDFTLRMRGLLEQDGYNPDGEEGPKCWGQEMILAHPGGVWSICSGFSIVEIPDGELWADGSGRAFALGAGYARAGNAKARLTSAIQAAINYDRGCGGKIFTAKLG